MGSSVPRCETTGPPTWPVALGLTIPPAKPGVSEPEPEYRPMTSGATGINEYNRGDAMNCRGAQ